MILDYIFPNRVYKKLTLNFIELSKFKKFKTIIFELTKNGKLSSVGIKADSKSNMYIGIDLNPELLLYSETSQESVELKLISEKMKKYNDFLTKEGILDVIKVDFERIKNNEFYGYVLQISFDFKKYKKIDLIYSILYFSIILNSLIVATLLLF